MAINIPMDELLQVIDNRDPNNSVDLNGFEVGGAIWRKPYTVTFPTKPTGVNLISCVRTSTESNCQTHATIVLDRGVMLYGDKITINASAATGYTKPLITNISGVDITDPDLDSHTGKVTGNVSFKVTAGPLETFLVSYIAKPAGVASFKIYAQEPGLSSSVYINNPTEPGSFSVPYGTKVYAVATAATGYNNPTVTGISTSSSSPTTVTGSIAAYVTAGPLRAYTLTISTIEGVATQTVKRGSTTLSNGATIYHGDVLTITATADEKYGLPTVTSPITVTGNVNTANYITAGEYKKYTVTIVSSNTTYGTVDTSSIIVGHGTILRSNDTSDSSSEIQTVGITAIWVPSTQSYTFLPDLSIIATASTVENAAINGNFDGWLINGSPDTNYPRFNFTVTDNVTITAQFSGVPQKYTVTINSSNTNYGTVSASYAADIPYGTAISASGSTLTIGTGTVTATANTATAQYTHSFNSWAGIPSSGKVTGNVTITANFTATVRNYPISITNAGYGTVKKPDGTSLVSGATVAYGTVLTLTPTTNTAQYSYSVASSTGTISTEGNLKKLLVDGAETITFSRTVNKYAITITNSSYGTVKNGSTTLSSGATVDYGTVLTITPNTDTAQYDYSVSSSTGTINSSNQLTVDGAETITFSRSTRKYTLTINNPTYGTVKNASGTPLSNGATVTYKEVLTVVPNTTTAQYTYGVDTSSGSFVITNGNRTLVVDGNETIIFSRTTNTYTVTVVPSNSNYGSVSPTTVNNVPYGTALSVSGSYAYVGSTKLTATPKTDTAQYDYQHTGWTGASGTVTGNTTVTANFRAVTRSYTVSYPAKPTGVSSFKIYKAGTAVVTNPTAAGSFTATYGEYVYATATAATGYNAPTISGISTNSGSPTRVTGAITVTLTAGSGAVESVWQTVWSGSNVISLMKATSGKTGTFSFTPTVWPTGGTKVRITGYGFYLGSSSTPVSYTDNAVTYSSSSNSYGNMHVRFTYQPNGTTNYATMDFNSLSCSGQNGSLGYEYTFSGASYQSFTVTKIEVYAPVASEPTVPKLSEPDVYIDQSVPDELYLEVSNNNDTSVTFYVIVYDSHNMAFGGGSTVLGAGTADNPLYLSLSSSVESGYIEAYFTADGYEDSEILIQEW